MVAKKNAAEPEGPIETGGRIATGADLAVLLSVLDAGAVDAIPRDSSAANASTPDPRLLLFRDRFGDAVEAFVSAVASELRGSRAFAELPRP